MWGTSQGEAMLDTHAATDHSDVCLSYLFTARDFRGTLGNNITQSRPVNLTDVSFSGIAYRGGVCRNHFLTLKDHGKLEGISLNTGFVTFAGNSLSSEPLLTFAHEVGHNLGAEHDGDGNHCDPNHYMMAAVAQTYSRDHSKIFSYCSKNYFRTELRSMVQVQ